MWWWNPLAGGWNHESRSFKTRRTVPTSEGWGLPRSVSRVKTQWGGAICEPGLASAGALIYFPAPRNKRNTLLLPPSHLVHSMLLQHTRPGYSCSQQGLSWPYCLVENTGAHKQVHIKEHHALLTSESPLLSPIMSKIVHPRVSPLQTTEQQGW